DRARRQHQGGVIDRRLGRVLTRPNIEHAASRLLGLAKRVEDARERAEARPNLRAANIRRSESYQRLNPPSWYPGISGLVSQPTLPPVLVTELIPSPALPTGNA